MQKKFRVHIIGTPMELEFFKNFVLRTMVPKELICKRLSKL